MGLRVIQIPVLSDNYVYLLCDEETSDCVVIDPAVSEPVIATLEKEGLKLVAIWNTHHHFDHVGGNSELVEKYGIPVYCGKYDFENDRVPCASHVLSDGDQVSLGDHEFQVFEVPGHTLGHIVYYGHEILFCGDTVFAGGCGRLFEGSPEQMFSSLKKIKNFSSETRVYCAHEYTVANLEFAKTVEADNQDLATKIQAVAKLRSQGLSTVPTTIAEELSYNPFLRAETAEEFARRRELKDQF